MSRLRIKLRLPTAEEGASPSTTRADDSLALADGECARVRVVREWRADFIALADDQEMLDEDSDDDDDDDAGDSNNGRGNMQYNDEDEKSDDDIDDDDDEDDEPPAGPSSARPSPLSATPSRTSATPSASKRKTPASSAKKATKSPGAATKGKTASPSASATSASPAPASATKRRSTPREDISHLTLEELDALPPAKRRKGAKARGASGPGRGWRKGLKMGQKPVYHLPAPGKDEDGMPIAEGERAAKLLRRNVMTSSVRY